MNFSLDERLVTDTFVIGGMALSRLLLMNDARWPWLILAARCGAWALRGDTRRRMRLR